MSDSPFLGRFLGIGNIHTYLERHCQTFDDRVSFLVSKLAVVRRQARFAAIASGASVIVLMLHAVAVIRTPAILFYLEYSLFIASGWVAMDLFRLGQHLDFLHSTFTKRKRILEALAHNRVVSKNRVLLYLRDFPGDVADTASTSPPTNAPLLFLSSGAILKRWIHRLKGVISIVEFTNVRERNSQAGQLDWSLNLVGEADWRETVIAVLPSVDAVVFQIRTLSSGVEWELQQAISRGLPALLLADADQQSAIEDMIQRDGGHLRSPITRAYYQPGEHTIDPRDLRHPLVVDIVSEKGSQRRTIGYGDFVRLVAEVTHSPALDRLQTRTDDWCG
jgi:hypothetical protein